MGEAVEPEVFINILTPRAGKVDEVIAHQSGAQKPSAAKRPAPAAAACTGRPINGMS